MAANVQGKLHELATTQWNHAVPLLPWQGNSKSDIARLKDIAALLKTGLTIPQCEKDIRTIKANCLDFIEHQEDDYSLVESCKICHEVLFAKEFTLTFDDGELTLPGYYKKILSLKSEVFRSQIKDSQNVDRIIIKNIPKSRFEYFIKTVYESGAAIPVDQFKNLEELYQVVDELKMPKEKNRINKLVDNGIWEVFKLKSVTKLVDIYPDVAKIPNGSNFVKKIYSLLECIIPQCKETYPEVINQLKRLPSVDIILQPRAKEDLKLITEHLPQTRFLDLSGMGWDMYSFTDADLASIAKLTQLTHLNLQGFSKITDEGIKHLKSLSQLSYLNLENLFEITNQGLRDIATLSNLTFLFLSSNHITDQGIEELLPQLKMLSDLKLSCSNLTNKTFASVAKLSQLKRLQFHSNHINDQGLHPILTLPLTELRVGGILSDGSHFSDVGLKLIAQLKDLTALELEDSPNVTDQGLEFIVTLTTLQRLKIGGPKITDKGLDSLAKLKSLNDIWFSCPKITNKGICAILGAVDPKEMFLSQCNLVETKSIRQFIEDKNLRCWFRQRSE